MLFSLSTPKNGQVTIPPKPVKFAQNKLPNRTRRSFIIKI